MRIAFFDPPPKHFLDPCPRPNCGQPLKHQIRNKWETNKNLNSETGMETPKEVNLENIEIVTPAPRHHHVQCECLKCGGYKDPSYYV